MIPTARSLTVPVVFGREQVAHCEAPVRPPAIRHLGHFVLGRKVIEAVRSLDRAPEREVAREKDVGSVESHEQEPARGPQPDPGHLGQGCLDLVVGHARERLIAQASVDEPLRERAQRLALSSREAAVAQHLGISREQLDGRRKMPSESLLEMRDDRPGRADRQLLARDLEDERPEGIERRKLVHPGPRTEVRPRVDQPREHRIRLPEELARIGIGKRGSYAGWSHPRSCFSSRSVSTMSMTSATVSLTGPVALELGRRGRPS